MIATDKSTHLSSRHDEGHAILGTFLERLSESIDEAGFCEAMAGAAAGLELNTFAYLTLPPQRSGKPKLINYPSPWTARYLQNRYQRVDPS
ncbi:autoinducer binding domain-containing protein [Mesorhizobium sp.]|uniref:autoinducer binding domain-containing protein n=1 Tax=Mesorhizobium sp. TaxID=1871066 RepID=UPI0025C1191F|nr:autoinducer binding domain-containing protein [Mesorhizobium sp.]